MVHVEHNSHITGINALQVHKNGREVVLEALTTVKLHAFDLPQAVHQSLRQLHFARMYVCDAVLFQPVLTGPQRGYANHIGCTVLQSPRILIEVVGIGRSHARSATAQLFDFDMFADAEATDAHTPHQRFVAGECHDVDVHVLHVDGNDTGGLSGIHNKHHLAFATDTSDLIDRLHRAQHIRAVVDDHEPGVRPHGRGNVVWIHEPSAVERDVSRFRTVVADHVVDGPDHGVVLEVGGDDVVAGRNQSGNDEIQRVGYVVAEDQAVRGIFVAAEEL